MAWIMSNPQADNAFTSLGSLRGDAYNVSEDCLSLLEDILQNLAMEDTTLRSFRRAIGFGQNIRKDLLPLLIHVKDDTKTKSTKIIDTTIKILVNLTIPVEYLMPTDMVSRTDIGRHTIFELNQLLSSSKEAFADGRSTKAITDHIKFIIDKDAELDIEKCDGINNCLLLLRNILHIPEYRSSVSSAQLAHSCLQNQIIWNLFTQSIDKIIIYLLSCQQKVSGIQDLARAVDCSFVLELSLYWGVTVVQLIALMYKDQHVGTLQKLLNLWLETSLSDSSEDNESNTSPPNQESGDSSPVVTSDPTSDSSDNGGSCSKFLERNKTNSKTAIPADRNKNNNISQNRSKTTPAIKRNKSTETESSSSGISLTASFESASSSKVHFQNSENLKSDHQPSQQIHGQKRNSHPSSQSEISDCGYGTQFENQESISTSSNDDEHPQMKPVHQKPHTFQKSRYKDGKSRAITILEKKDLRRKKLVKRSKTNIINMKGLLHHLPTDEDITSILKEFTVDFLLKGYGVLIQTLHSQLLSNMHVDTSHFFWLMTYFLKLATQLELDLEHIAPVLSYDILAFLVFQGVWLCEELEISCKSSSCDLKPCLRRLHLVVTAIREYLQAVETYQKMIHLSAEERSNLIKLQIRISETDDLKCLFLLLLRHYNPEIQSKQYLQDLILTNHNYLLFLDNILKVKEQSTSSVVDHLKEFATVDIMRQYGVLLEDFKHNGEFVNNCIFTMMHHIGGDLENIPTLFQPRILKTFSQIWETDFELCDDWSDLIEYVIHKFINTRQQYPSDSDTASPQNENGKLESKAISQNLWTKEDKNNLLGYYKQCRDTEDTIAHISQKYYQSGITNKTQTAIIKELLGQNIINESQYNDFMEEQLPEKEKETPCEELQNQLCIQEQHSDNEIRTLKERLFRENKGSLLLWLQRVLTEVCFVKLFLSKPEAFKDNQKIMEPTTYYYALLNLPIPVVPWFAEQSSVLEFQPFVVLLHKLGFYLPVDTGKIFVRIPNFWNAEYVFSVAQQLGPIDPAKLKFDVSLLQNQSSTESEMKETSEITVSSDGTSQYSMNDLKMPSVVRYTPLPNSSELFENYLQPFQPVVNNIFQNSCSNQLSITIPDVAFLAHNLPPPKLSIVDQAKMDIPANSSPMDCSAGQDTPVLLNDDIEHASICETASVASDLTRMCVSDEDEKSMIVSDDENR